VVIVSHNVAAHALSVFPALSGRLSENGERPPDQIRWASLRTQ